MKKNEEISKLIVGRFKTLISELKVLDETYARLNNERIEMGNKLESYKNAKTDINNDIIDIFRRLAESNSEYVRMGQTIDNYMNKIGEVNSIITIIGIDAKLDEEQNLILKDCLDNVAEYFVIDKGEVIKKDIENKFIKDLYAKAVTDTVASYEKSYKQMIGND